MEALGQLEKIKNVHLNFTICKLSQILYEMGTEGYTSIVLDQKLSYIQFHLFKIPQWRNPKMINLVTQYIIPFLRKMALNYMLIGMCPFILRKVTMRGDTYESLVPIALNLEDLVIEVANDHQMEQVYRIYRVDEDYRHPLKIYYTRSERKSGPSTQNSHACVSDMGSLVKEYKTIETRKEQIQKHTTSFLKRNYIIQPTNYTNAAKANHTADAVQAYQDNAAKYGEDFGFPDPAEDILTNIKDNSEFRTSVIPTGFELCSFQNQLDVNLLNYHQLDVEYKKNVNMTFKMRPVGETTTKYQNTESQEHNNLQLKNALEEITDDLKNGIVQVLTMIYPDFPLDSTIELPHTSLIDTTTIISLFENNVIDDVWRNQEIFKILGISREGLGVKKRHKLNEED